MFAASLNACILASLAGEWSRFEAVHNDVMSNIQYAKNMATKLLFLLILSVILFVQSFTEKYLWFVSTNHTYFWYCVRTNRG
jgi:hypothetical protein